MWTSMSVPRYVYESVASEKKGIHHGTPISGDSGYMQESVAISGARMRAMLGTGGVALMSRHTLVTWLPTPPGGAYLSTLVHTT